MGLDAEPVAALGFVAVAVVGRGTPGRSKSFHDASYGHLADAGCLAYVRKRCWDFLVRELLGTQPPTHRPAAIAVDPELLGELLPGARRHRPTRNRQGRAWPWP